MRFKYDHYLNVEQNLKFVIEKKKRGAANSEFGKDLGDVLDWNDIESWKETTSGVSK